MHIIVLGAGYAGVTATLRLSSSVGTRHRVTLVNANTDFVERIRLHEAAAGRPPASMPLSSLLAGTCVELVVGRVTGLDVRAQRIQLPAGELRWDRLVLALGSQVDMDSVPGVSQYASTLEGAGVAALAAELQRLASRAGRVTIVGGGLTGIEAAAELAEALPQLRISLVTRGRAGAELSPRAQRHIGTRLRAAGVELREGVHVRRVEAGALVAEDLQLPFDLCLWAAGFAVPRLVAEAGLAVNARGQVLVDRQLRVRSKPAVYAAGDLAALDPQFGAELPMGCKSALPTGAHAARSLAAELAGDVAKSLQLRTPLYCLSLGRRDGVIQLRAGDGSLHGPVITGRIAAAIKEGICTGTRLALRLEARRAARYPEAASEPLLARSCDDC